MKRFSMWFWGRVWCASERTGVSLGRAGPWVLGKMLGASGYRRRVRLRLVCCGNYLKCSCGGVTE